MRRRLAQSLGLVLTTVLVSLTCAVLGWGGIPRSYEDIRRLESALPQHRWEEVRVGTNGELVDVETGKRFDWEEDAGAGYLRFPDHIWGHGFNNVFEEALSAALLAHLSDRTYVFEDYVWSHSPLPYTLYNFALRQKRVPLNAFVSGFIAGEKVHSPSNTTDHVRANISNPLAFRRLSISAHYYDYVCPSTLSVDHRLVLFAGDAPTFKDSSSQLEWWSDRIKVLGKGKRCVEIREGDGNAPGPAGRRMFDNHFFGSREHVAPLVPKLIESPVLGQFSWSPLVEDAVKRTAAAIGITSESDDTMPHTVPGLLAVHLRRGDYSRHCARLSLWESNFMGFAYADGVMDQLNITQALQEEREHIEDGATVDRRKALEQHYMKRCLPSIPQIVQRAREVREYWAHMAHPSASYTPLTRILLLSNGWPAWLLELSDALEKEGWEVVDPDAGIRKGIGKMQDIDVAVDMALAERAEAFLGNGFSTLTGNIVVLRMASGHEVESNRLF
ncbi:hypothetical protein DFP72DRAFT_826345 [Ephemerocybe angulata]|uniref:Uncharacterized protein n=1 Tax=Ephemerocybe angulata TaxID=980116 RepID=A0A8H6LVW9_9AGAR|nr:hypothetical protein DFP72DRAFT_826345 [Tulosesus angulatus]